MGIFATVAICLACIGVFGVMSHAIGQRVRELSIRTALGAQRGDILRLVMAGGMRPALAGIAVGLVAALASGRFVESQLFEVRARDPFVFFGSVCILMFVAAVSIYLPAHRASRVDPALALRSE